MCNFVRELDQQILAFMSEARNEPLRCGTGAFSTLFRGTLFGLSRGSEVTTMLAVRKADVLVLLSNPHVERSLSAIRGDVPPEDLLGEFEQQMDVDHFGQRQSASTGFALGWDPRTAPEPHWRKFMRDVIAPLCPGQATDGVAVANFFAWGSKDYKRFFSKKNGVGGSPDLIVRALKLADNLHRRVVAALDPAVVVVISLSLATQRNPEGTLVSPSLVSLDGLSKGWISAGRTGSRFFSGRIEYVGRRRVVGVLPHASWRGWPAADTIQVTKTLQQL